MCVTLELPNEQTISDLATLEKTFGHPTEPFRYQPRTRDNRGCLCAIDIQEYLTAANVVWEPDSFWPGSYFIYGQLVIPEESVLSV